MSTLKMHYWGRPRSTISSAISYYTQSCCNWYIAFSAFESDISTLINYCMQINNSVRSLFFSYLSLLTFVFAFVCHPCININSSIHFLMFDVTLFAFAIATLLCRLLHPNHDHHYQRNERKNL